MDLRKLDKALYEDEEFLKYLPLLKEENWKKAKPTQRIKFFEEVQRVLSELDDTYPSVVKSVQMDEDEEQYIIFREDCTFINSRLFAKTINPYEIIANYFFELAIADFFESVADEEFCKTEFGQRIMINASRSFVGEWDNYYGRRSEEFYYQPIIRESSKISRMFLYNLLSYMNNTYGMDGYIGSKIANIMINSFNEEKTDKRVEENYKKMHENMDLFTKEVDDLEALNEYINSVDYSKISDEELYAFFNVKIMNLLNFETINFLFRLFVQRELKGFNLAKDVADTCEMGLTEDEELYIELNGCRYFANDYCHAFYYLITFLANVKLDQDLDTGINNPDLIKEAKQCYGYMFELRDESGEVPCKYLSNGFSYEEYKHKFINNYYKKISEAIKKSQFFNNGSPSLYKIDFSKFNAYLKFTWDMDFEEVKRRQFRDLEKAYKEKMNGGTR